MPPKKKSQGLISTRPIVGSAIAWARSKRNWTQLDLALKSGVSRNTIAFRERAVSVRWDLASEFDAAFGGPEWRIIGTPQHDEANWPQVLEVLHDVAVQVQDLKRHVLLIERNMLNRRRKK